MIIDFSSIPSQVIFGTFYMDIPPTFKMIALEESPAPGKGGKCPKPEGDNKQNKKKGTKGDKPWDLIKNEHPNTKLCMLTNKMWAINFANKQVDKHPWWNKKNRCCPWWFLQKPGSATAKTRRVTSRQMRSQWQNWPKWNHGSNYAARADRLGQSLVASNHLHNLQILKLWGSFLRYSTKPFPRKPKSLSMQTKLQELNQQYSPGEISWIKTNFSLAIPDRGNLDYPPLQSNRKSESLNQARSTIAPNLSI